MSLSSFLRRRRLRKKLEVTQKNRVALKDVAGFSKCKWRNISGVGFLPYLLENLGLCQKCRSAPHEDDHNDDEKNNKTTNATMSNTHNMFEVCLNA